ncbi:MAG: hypothetical protein FWD68_02640 [Alphaproteobacteria bacterium]|nr:hypothetical protein [Alphaproteobacteria bacterium]
MARKSGKKAAEKAERKTATRTAPEAGTPEPLSQERWKCPVSHCDGWVSHVGSDEIAFWGCGECGSVWLDKDNLVREAREIVARFPYRAAFHEDVGGRLRPSRMIGFPGNSEKVEGEPVDTYPDFERG